MRFIILIAIEFNHLLKGSFMNKTLKTQYALHSSLFTPAQLWKD